MKRIIAIAALLLAIYLVAGCQKEPAKKGPIYYPDYPYYQTVGELVESMDTVFEGKVTAIHFTVIDIATDECVTTPSPDGNLVLHTVYEVEVSHTYKGDACEKQSISIIGGIPGYREDEQFALLEQCGIRNDYTRIPMLASFEPMKIGTTRLFVCYQTTNGYLGVPNLLQYSFESNESDKAGESSAVNYHGIISYFQGSQK